MRDEFMKKIVKVEKIDPKPSRCIEVDTEDRLFAAGGSDGSSFVSHNSVVQRNIILGTILRPDNWRFLGIDLKKVELSGFRAYSNVVLGIATTIEDALTVLRFAQQTMMKRYTEMERMGVNNFLDIPEHGPALLVMVDEAGELLSLSGVKALSGETIVPTVDGPKLLKDVEIGDILFDNRSKEAKVTKKYIPENQERFEMTVRRDRDDASEKFISGAEHFWVAYFEEPDGTITGPTTVDTSYLFKFSEEQKLKPESSRIKVKFKKETANT